VPDAYVVIKAIPIDPARVCAAFERLADAIQKRDRCHRVEARLGVQSLVSFFAASDALGAPRDIERPEGERGTAASRIRSIIRSVQRQKEEAEPQRAVSVYGPRVQIPTLYSTSSLSRLGGEGPARNLRRPK
jgi:hypothetical protein